MNHQKGSGIKPGCLCIFRSRVFKDHPNNGQIVTVIREATAADCVGLLRIGDAKLWLISGRDLLRPLVNRSTKEFIMWDSPRARILVNQNTLTPINDPDQQIDTVTDKELENV